MSTAQSYTPDAVDLTDDEMLFIADHLAACAAYLDHLDELWIGDEETLEDIAPDDVESIPELTQGQASMLRSKVFRSIRRSDLTARTLDLGTRGFMQVLLAMIRPIMETQRQ